MYRYSVIYDGNVLNLSGVEKKWQIISVTGLNPPVATQNESNVVGAAVVKITGSNIGKRAIVFTIRINYPCELNRAELLSFLGSNNEITLHIQSKYKDLYIDGVVETNDYDIYTNSQIMQVSILCGYPYFKASEERVTKSIVSKGGFTFPFSVDYDKTVQFDEFDILDRLFLYNYGQIPTGLIIELDVYENSAVKVYNVDNENEFFTFNEELRAGDKVIINTNMWADEKCVIIRNGVKTKFMNKLVRGVTWFTLKKVLVLGVSGKAYMTIRNHDEIAGV